MIASWRLDVVGVPIKVSVSPAFKASGQVVDVGRRHQHGMSVPV